jgi:citrate lyase subunit beta/citryl-CoA lyase
MVGKRLLDMHVDRRTRVWAMMETPLALLHAREIAAAALDSETRFSGFVIGTNDLAKETGTRLLPGRWPMLPWLMMVVAAARAYGLVVLDGVYNDIGNVQGFAEECAQARDMGLDGKTVIHPSQIEPCNAAFSPSPDEVAQARRIIAAFEEPENKNKGVVALDGRMVERLHADMARRTVAVANAIAQPPQS